jgi:hypothetical protein
MGAVIFIDFWLIKKFGLQSNYAEVSKKTFNVAAFVAYFVPVVVCGSLVLGGVIQIYFVSLPGWFMAAALYIVGSAIYQRKIYETPLFRTVSQLISWISLGVLILLGILFLAGSITLDQVKWLGIVVTITWFVSAALWMWKDNGTE